MNTLLTIETSTPQGSVALLGWESARENARLLFHAPCRREPGGAGLETPALAGRNHSSLLFTTLEEALRAAGMPGSATPGSAGLTQIVVGLGPGSYAGVRIALAAAQGLAMATGAELLGIPSVVGLGDEPAYLAVGDARRGSYAFTRVQAGECAEGPLLCPAQELAERLAHCPLPLFTSEALELPPQCVFSARPRLRHPNAERLARLAASGRSLLRQTTLEPLYLRPPYITTPGKNTPRTA